MFLRLRNRVQGILRSESAASSAVRPAAAAVAAPTAPELHEDDPACPREIILELDRCPVCETPESTRVGRYNKFLLQEHIPDRLCAVYNYALCHGCGVVYATSRPSGVRYAWLLEHFEASIGRADFGERRPGKLTL